MAFLNAQCCRMLWRLRGAWSQCGVALMLCPPPPPAFAPRVAQFASSGCPGKIWTRGWRKPLCKGRIAAGAMSISQFVLP